MPKYKVEITKIVKVTNDVAGEPIYTIKLNKKDSDGYAYTEEFVLDLEAIKELRDALLKLNLE